MAMLINGGVNIQSNDKQLAELFGERGDMFLTKVPARLASERGYGNMMNRKKPLKPTDDVNICFPTPKTHQGIFNCVKSDFPKGAGGVEPNPMWADGTYEQMKADFIRQAERQIDSEHILNLIPERDLRYDLAKYTGGTAQQNKLDFAVSEMFNEEKRKVLLDKIGLVKVKYPTATVEQATDIAIDEMVGMELGTKQYNLLSEEHKAEVRNFGREKLFNLLVDTQGANPTAEDAQRLKAQRAREEVEYHSKGATMAEMPKKASGVKTDAQQRKEIAGTPYMKGRIREMGGIDYTGGGLPPQQAPPHKRIMSSGYTGGAVRAFNDTSHLYTGLINPYQHTHRRDLASVVAGMVEGVGGLPRPLPLQAGGGGSGGGMRRGGGTSIQPDETHSRNALFPGVRARGF